MTDLDPMDRRLREYAGRWRDAAAPPPVVDKDLLPSRSTKRAWLAAGIAAAAVAAGIAVGTTFAGHDDVAKPPKPAHTAQPSAVVPWAPLPATHPTIPTTTTPASPDPAEAAGKPACRASDVRVTSTVGPAAGTYYMTVRLTLVGDHPCRLEGYPELEPLDAGHPVAIPVEHDPEDTVYRHPVLVATGRPALLRLRWTSDWCAAPVHNDTIRMVLPDGGSLTFEGLGGSQCYGRPGNGSRSPIVTGTFEPVKARGGKVRSAYADVDVTGDLDLTASPEDALHFTVTLTSPRDLRLDPCPDYRIIQSGSGKPREASFALNCAAVPYRDDSGRPYLPAATPVRFATQSAVGPAGTYKFSWLFDTVDQRGVGGTLTVVGETVPATPQTRDDALRQALASNPSVRAETLGRAPQGKVLCGINVLGSSTDGRTLYVWLLCGDFVVVDGTVPSTWTGSSEPAVVQVAGSGSPLRIEKVTFPRQQSLDADIRRLFPPELVDRVTRGNIRVTPSADQLEAEALSSG